MELLACEDESWLRAERALRMSCFHGFENPLPEKRAQWALPCRWFILGPCEPLPPTLLEGCGPEVDFCGGQLFPCEDGGYTAQPQDSCPQGGPWSPAGSVFPSALPTVSVGEQMRRRACAPPALC